MRLLDLVAQSASPSPGLPREWPLPSPCHFAGDVAGCPLRLVLSDGITACATLLAYAEGQRLSSCLDLLHAPAQQLWVEWQEESRVAAINQVANLGDRPRQANARRSGVLIRCDSAARCGSLRSFWSTPDDQCFAAATIADFNLNEAVRPPLDVAAAFRGEAVGVCLPGEPAIDELLTHVNFRLDPAWVAYYRSAALTQPGQAAILHSLLGATAFDFPMLMALFLLYAARDGVSRRPSDLMQLNHRRLRRGKPPLIEHIEVESPLLGPTRLPSMTSEVFRYRRGPRMHHVRGHLARRGNKVFWRSPHLRGSARLGIIRSRTVELVMP